MSTTSDHPLRAGLGLWTYTVCALAVKQLSLGSAMRSADDSVVAWLFQEPNVIAAAVGGALVTAGWTLLLPLAPRVWALAFANLVITALMVADCVCLQQGGTLISLRDVLQRPEMAGAIVDSVAAGLSPGYIVYFVDILIIVVAVRSRGRVEGTQSAIPRLLAGAAATLVGVMLIAPSVEDAGSRQTSGDAPRPQSWPTLGVVPYHLLELINGHSRSSLNASDAPVVRIRLSRRRHQAVSPLHPAPAASPEIDPDGLVFREAPLANRLQFDFDLLTPMSLDCSRRATRREVACDEMRQLQSDQALLEGQTRAPSGDITQRGAAVAERSR